MNREPTRIENIEPLPPPPPIENDIFMYMIDYPINEQIPVLALIHNSQWTIEPHLLFCESDDVLNTEEECPICWECIPKHAMDTTLCEHTFCHSCIFRHLQSNTQCPLCRTSIQSICVRTTENYNEFTRK